MRSIGVFMMFVFLVSSLTGCGIGELFASEDEGETVRETIEKARFFDYQTRYQIQDENARGFGLQVFVNARGRSLGHSGIRLLQDSVARIAQRHAQDQGRSIRPIDISSIDMAAQPIAATKEWVWIANTDVAWAPRDVDP